MIVVDTSVWIDHLHRAEPSLVEFLGRNEVGVHDAIVEELAAGRLADRAAVLGAMAMLRRTPTLAHDEILSLVERRSLWGSGLSAVDIHLLGAMLLLPGSVLWTRDKRLRSAAAELGIVVAEA